VAVTLRYDSWLRSACEIAVRYAENEDGSAGRDLAYLVDLRVLSGIAA
jgi:hypothetical protein